VRIDGNISGLFDSLTQINFVAEFHRENASFTRKTALAFLSHPLGGLRGNVCDSSLAGWEARGQRPVGYNWIFFAISYGCGSNSLNRPLLKGVGHFGAEYYFE